MKRLVFGLALGSASLVLGGCSGGNSQTAAVSANQQSQYQAQYQPPPAPAATSYPDDSSSASGPESSDTSSSDETANSADAGTEEAGGYGAAYSEATGRKGLVGMNGQNAPPPGMGGMGYSGPPPEVSSPDYGSGYGGAAGGYAGPGIDNPGFGGPTSEPVRKLEDMTFRERAELAFSKGHEKDAVALIMAHALADPSDASDILEGYRWSPVNRQPQLISRVAVGVDLKAPPNLTSYNPIRAASVAQGGPGGSDGGMDGYGGGMGMPGQPSQGGSTGKSLDSITGDLGKALIDHTNEIFLAGQMGPIFATASDTVTPANAPNNGMAGGYGSDDMYGGAMGMGGMMGMGGQAGRNSGLGKLANPNRNRLAPGLTYLGVDSLSDLQSKAKAEGMDLLVVFEVSAEASRRTQVVQNDTKIRCFKLNDKKPVATTETLSSTDVMRKMMKGDNEIVEKVMNRVFSKVDPEISLVSLPAALNADIIKKSRMTTLTTGAGRDRLASLSELQLWHHKKFLTDEELAKAYETLLGEADAKTLAEGSTEERKTLLSKYLPK